MATVYKSLEMIYMSKQGVRYGAELRKRAEKVQKSASQLFACPRCGKKKVKRSGNSVWICKSCNAKFAGGTYAFSTPSGEVAARLIEEYKKR